MRNYFRVYCSTVALLLLTSLFLVPTSSFAIEPRVNIQPQTGDVESIFVLGVTLPGVESDSVKTPAFEPSDQFAIVGSGTSTSLSITNGKQAKSISFSFNIAPDRNLKPGNYRLPKGIVEINGKPVALKQPVIRIVKSNTDLNQQGKNPVKFHHFVDKENPYIGEQVLYSVEIEAEAEVREISMDSIDFPGFWVESFDKKSHVVRQFDPFGKRMESQRTAIFPLSTGKIEVAGRAMVAQVLVRQNRRPRRPSPFGRDSLFNLDTWGGFGRSRIKRLRYELGPIALKAKPLPPYSGDYQGYTPVGKMKLASVFNYKEAEVGDSLYMTITLSGEGNLSALELPSPSGKDVRDFKFYKNSEKTATREIDGVIWTTKQFEVEFVPKRAGEFRLPQIELVSFDPKSKKYKSHKSAAGSLVVFNDPSNPTDPAQNQRTEQADLEDTKNDKKVKDPLAPLSKAPGKSFNPGYFLQILALLSLLATTFFAAKSLLGRLRAAKEESPVTEFYSTLNSLNSEGTNLDTIHKTVQSCLGIAKNENIFPEQALKEKFRAFLKDLDEARYSGGKPDDKDRNWQGEAKELLQKLGKAGK